MSAEIRTGPGPGPATAGQPVPRCNRCGFEVRGKPWGCKNPCPNCGTVYPLGDCSD